ncbi:MAG TPA: hypothetical protein VLH37_10355, partial [Bacteroidales bacterium]|nr:hypothetical protein [Bacteroidales bacterium]
MNIMFRKLSVFLFLAAFSFSIQAIPFSNTGLNLNEQDEQLNTAAKISPNAASEYIRHILQNRNLWKPENEILRQSLIRLIEQYNEPYDTVRTRLGTLQQNIPVYEPFQVLRADTLPVRWLNRNTFIVDTMHLERNPVIIQQTIVYRTVDPASIPYLVPITDVQLLLRTLLHATDTITDTIIDTRFLESRLITIHRVENGRIMPPLVKPGNNRTARFLADGKAIVVTESKLFYRAQQPSLLHYVLSPGMPDSLSLAVNSLLDYTFLRDSLPLIIRNFDGQQTGFWLSAGKNDPMRFWAKNARHDSVTIWVGNPSKYEISLVLEDDVFIERLARR